MDKQSEIESALAAANALRNPLSGLEALLSVSVKNDDTTDTVNSLVIEYQTSPLSKDMQKQCLALFEDNMGDMYRKSDWGLDMEEKEQEFVHENARFLLVHSLEDPNVLLAFCHFRFDTNDDDGPTEAVLYVYEIQVSQKVRRLGLGRRLMTILELVARQANLNKTMLTVFTNNTAAWTFYTHKMKYQVDDISPSRQGESTEYEILSKSVR